jgi:RNA polymerase sigma factor (TIGR02999 family)
MNMPEEKLNLPSGAPDCGELASSNELFQLVYDELHKLAAARLKHERPGQTLQPTALVHEVFLRLVVPNENQMWDNIPHFFSAAASAMRRVLIDNARKKHSLKRGGDHQKIEFSLEEVAVEFGDEHLIRLDEALAKLAEQDPVKAKLIELRFFGGLTVEQSCEALGISRATANRYWNYARAWLFLQVSENGESEQTR